MTHTHILDLAKTCPIDWIINISEILERNIVGVCRLYSGMCTFVHREDHSSTAKTNGLFFVCTSVCNGSVSHRLTTLLVAYGWNVQNMILACCVGRMSCVRYNSMPNVRNMQTMGYRIFPRSGLTPTNTHPRHESSTGISCRTGPRSGTVMCLAAIENPYGMRRRGNICF